ncbi:MULTISPECIES: peptidoglycan-binding protein [unclassified Frankia]|uniref:peptidoglycan-binding protein n=1 Tax=unclassified Frankia TaxID=2632575 RepID=UPI002AD5AF9C|nr:MULTISPECIES: peptidoglycan-binding protein [unclassified Frankia]
MTRGRHRKQSQYNRGAVAATAGVIGATAGMMLTAGPANASPAAASGAGTAPAPGASSVAATPVPDASIAGAGRKAGLGGCDGKPLQTWVAVALAESGGNANAHNPNGEDSRGLWQINMRAHAGWVGGADLFDPAINAQAAKRVCDMQGIGAWSTYTNGSYRVYLGRAAAAATEAAGDGATGTYQADPTGPGGPTGPVSTPVTPVTPVTTPDRTAAADVAPARRVADPVPRAREVRYTHRGRPGVRQIQRALTGRGYPVVADGKFGPHTTNTVKAYQRRHGLAADGVVGARTRAALFSFTA